METEAASAYAILWIHDGMKVQDLITKDWVLYRTWEAAVAAAGAFAEARCAETPGAIREDVLENWTTRPSRTPVWGVRNGETPIGLVEIFRVSMA